MPAFLKKLKEVDDWLEQNIVDKSVYSHQTLSVALFKLTGCLRLLSQALLKEQQESLNKDKNLEELNKEFRLLRRDYLVFKKKIKVHKHPHRHPDLNKAITSLSTEFTFLENKLEESLKQRGQNVGDDLVSLEVSKEQDNIVQDNTAPVDVVPYSPEDDDDVDDAQ